MNSKIRTEYKQILHKIEDVCKDFDTTQSVLIIGTNLNRMQIDHIVF